MAGAASQRKNPSCTWACVPAFDLVPCSTVLAVQRCVVPARYPRPNGRNQRQKANGCPGCALPDRASGSDDCPILATAPGEVSTSGVKTPEVFDLARQPSSKTWETIGGPLTSDNKGTCPPGMGVHCR